MAKSVAKNLDLSKYCKFSRFKMWNQQSAMNVSALEGSERISGSELNCHLLQDKKLFESSGEDSGFLSGPQNLYSSESIDLQSNVLLPDIDNFGDSGAIPDIEDEQQDNTKDPKEKMIFRSGIDANMSEWLCKLNLKDSETPMNNLNNCGKQLHTQAKDQEQNRSILPQRYAGRPLWQTCYLQDADGDTHLHLAILGKYVQAVRAIIRMAPVPAFLDLRNDDAHAPLHFAVMTKQPELVRSLLLAGANANIRDNQGNTPLHLACLNSDTACIYALTAPVTREDLQHGYFLTGRIPQVPAFDLELRNWNGMHCVHIAAQRNDIDTLRLLVRLGADINAKEGRSGYNVLHFACEKSYNQLALFLLSECTQLNIEACTYGQLTAYQIAAEQENHTLMAHLESYGAVLLSPPESDDDSMMDSSEEDFKDYESDDFELN
ncbi:NF-kappa-B inhibitor cactus [Pseudolycoriella hygida]|uniref:NF-kappa-B inhibitor cactus n=1 Tax=Pseudolycoriella hygida TaxID=35572 RepID=A0A9Q0NCH9_9DIPT|nr:NF-kappa-B inhibitor cactus [Pseudolycoriella hygida]